MDRADRISQEIGALEREYVAVLTRALNECASGRWGLFGQNEHLHADVTPPAELEELRELASEINRLRARLGDEPYLFHEEFEAARGAVGSNDLGEPKQAKVWLKRLADT